MLAPTKRYVIEKSRRAKNAGMLIYLGLAAVAAAGYVIGRFSDTGVVDFFRRLRTAQ